MKLLSRLENLLLWINGHVLFAPADGQGSTRGALKGPEKYIRP